MKPVMNLYPDWGIFFVRITMGFLFAIHGWQKFAGGLDRVVGGFTKMGIPFPGAMGPLIATLELVGGILLILGLATRWIGVLFVCEMLVTTFYVHTPQGWNSADLDRVLLASAILIFLGGAGRLALDNALARPEPQERAAARAA